MKLLLSKKIFSYAVVYVTFSLLFPNILPAQVHNIQVLAESPDNHPISIENNLTLSSKTFSLYWQTDSTIEPLYRYRLIPYSEDWTNWSPRNSASFFNLKEGTYFFLLEMPNGETKEISIHIDLPIWQHTLFYIGSIVLISFLAFVLIVILFKQRIRKITHNIEDEFRKAFRIKQKAQQKNTGTTALAVKEQARIRSRKYKKVTVLFADIQGFTKIVEHINPETLIDELDRFFFYFDGVVEKYNIEKIKTIGDAYMCAGGIPSINRTNPIEVVLAGLEMQKFMFDSKQQQNTELGFWELRIGIHTGPVISGEIGRKNVSFDIWGDTVNIASRMESSGTAGMINITGVTYELIKDFFECDYRGKMPIKYKGETDMYYVRRIRPELSADTNGIFPNQQFNVKLQHIRFGDIEEFILDKLENELMPDLFYHNKAHTKDVITQVEIIGRGEKVSSEDLLLLKTAALLHDVGFLVEYSNHEDNSISFAKEILPQYYYHDYQIDQIVELINVTRVGHQPKNYLEKILKDADLDYLGRADFISISDNLYKELNRHNGKMSMDEWNKMQYEFISQHTYYTNTARRLRQVNKERQLQKLKVLVTN
ncbi:guanylate cyclase [Carboxylicivirga sediminis]|uniref:adenylate cyclase n=1 Tax=Carboxylicivirga sediminis TaxID=2006564 RepID=A0A941F7G9_9BACT|nr:adenylate/guanylate cyclase domain-containing protein [Carboxylicivirga sediminis]MBR8537079.1 guanylate cyclase [Carboxylicivirga sediminis]